MQLARLAWMALALSGCAAPAITRESRVAVRQRSGEADAALALLYQSDLCKVTLRDRSGRLHDSVLQDGEPRPISMTRDVPNGVWRVQNSNHRSTLLTALAMPPGSYEVVAYATSDAWAELDTDSGPALGETDCEGGLDWHAVRLPFRIEARKITLLSIPGGPFSFADLNRMLHAPNDPLVHDASSSWFPAIKQARKDRKAELAASRRQARAGYDVHPDCDGRTAIVRNTGTPFGWYADVNDDAKREEFRYRAQPAIRSVHATGFGAGCVRGAAFMVFLSDPSAVEPATRAIGEWLVREDLSGEVDLVLSAMPVLH